MVLSNELLEEKYGVTSGKSTELLVELIGIIFF